MRSKPISLVQGDSIATLVAIDVNYIYKGSSIDCALLVYGVNASGETLIKSCSLKIDDTGRAHKTFIIDNDETERLVQFVGVRSELLYNAGCSCVITSLKYITDNDPLFMAQERSM